MRFKSFEFNRMEFGGAFGDLGTLIPLATALITINRLNPTTVFLMVGLLYMGAGLYYQIPIPVQPMKLMAAVAIASGVGPPIIASAGLLIGVILLFLSLSNAASLFARLFSRPVVKGIQLGIGILLLKRGITLALRREMLVNFVSSAINLGGLVIPKTVLIAIGAGVLLLIFRTNKQYPASMVLISFGVLVGLFRTKFSSLTPGPVLPTVFFPSGNELWQALFLLVIPQLPLTFGNAIVATSSATKVYFGGRAARVSCRSLPMSMGMANILTGLFMGMPLCHGSGGLTAHYRFGARTGGANIIMGVFYVILALVFGRAAAPLLSIIPLQIIGVLLAFVGFQHALLIRYLDSTEDFLVALLIGGTAVAVNNMAIAFGVGILLSLLLKQRRRISRLAIVRFLINGQRFD